MFCRIMFCNKSKGLKKKFFLNNNCNRYRHYILHVTKRAPLLGLAKSTYYVTETVFQFDINYLAEIQLKLF